VSLAKSAALNYGVPDLCLVVVPHPIGGIGPEEVRRKVDTAFPDILKAATQWKPETTELPPPAAAYPAKTLTFRGTYSDLNRWMFKNGLSLGLPMVPPTREAVDAMLKGTSHKPEEIVWDRVPPRMGVLTVEAVAICAVMAGSRPEYMPIILAAMEGFKSPNSLWVHMQVTTGTESALVLVNGPIIKELAALGEEFGIAFSTGAAGPGHLANVSIGYTISLISYIVGGAKPGSVAMSTLGSPAETVSYVIAENEDALPAGWSSHAVEKGFKKTDSVVSVKIIYPAMDVSDHNSTTAAQHLNYWAHNINIPFTQVVPSAVMLAIAPEHTDLLASEGWTKDKIREYLWEQARYPYSVIPPVKTAQTRLPEWFEKKYGPITPNTMIPITDKPEGIEIIVTGGPGKHSQFFYGGRTLISVPIDRWK
jgi:hypothetical protein